MPSGNASLRRHNATKALFGISLSGQHPRFSHGLNHLNRKSFSPVAQETCEMGSPVHGH